MERGEIKKLYILYILEILKRYSDADHRLTQQDIIRYMEKDYGAVCDRKTISRNIGDLMEAGYEIEHDRQGYYFDGRTFEDSELRLLIDSVMASRYIPKKHADDLVSRLIEQSGVHFKKRIRHIYSLDNMERAERNELFWNLECIGDAIEDNRQIAFYYNKYGEDKKLHRTTERKHVVNPYYITIANGRYYLVGNNDKYSDITHFRMERISDVEILEDIRRPKEEITDFKDGQGLSKHMLEHVYMFSGPSVRVMLKVGADGINDCIDWLGRDVGIRKEDDFFIVDTVTNKQAIKYWAVQFGEKVEVLSPPDLREDIRRMVEAMCEKYRR
ncbi:MAG: WYL domain-containing protein [Anaerovoracaceae bacterium]|nr:WYL domain-containing protein [Anaerovoracaceae bacterium]